MEIKEKEKKENFVSRYNSILLMDVIHTVDEAWRSLMKPGEA